MHNESTGAQGGVKRLLQLEGLALFAAAVGFHLNLGMSWKLFAVLFLVPDASMAFYLAGPRIGAVAYNATHTTLGPVAAIAAGYFLHAPLALAVGLIWASHVGIDRALGFGLKYATAFGDTHLGRIGRAARAAAA
jgi:hypothetical protein